MNASIAAATNISPVPPAPPAPAAPPTPPTSSPLWTAGRTRHIRFYVTEEEFDMLRHLAFAESKTVSRYTIELALEAARGRVVEMGKGKKK